MTTIDASESVCTLINVFTVKPENHEALFELLQNATQEVMCKLPGYISANLHLSDDTKRITNYAQWRSLDDFKNALLNEEAQKHRQAAAALAESFEPHTYHIIWQHHAESNLV